MTTLDALARQLGNAVAVIVACCCFVGCAAFEPSPEVLDPQALLGTWTVDLRPTPSSDPYYRDFIVSAVDGNTFTGTFYDTPVSQGRINTDWGKLRIAFVTTDGSGPYNHSAVLEGATLEGLSNSTGRNFLSYWSAVRE